MIANREDVLQAALTVERWCKKTDCKDCPFWKHDANIGHTCCFYVAPMNMELAEHLRTRGLQHEK